VKQPPNKSRSIFDWKAILGILLGAGLLYWALHDVNFREVVTEVRRANPWWFALSVFCATVVFPLRAWRWGPLLETVTSTRFRSRYAATTIGFMGNNLLPARIGEFARAFALSRQEKTSVVTAFASLVAERLFDMIAVVTFVFVAVAMPGFPERREIQGYDLSGVSTLMALGATALVGICVALVIWPERMVRFFEHRVAPVLPMRVRRPLVDALEAFLAGLGSLRSPGLVAQVSFQTLLIWFVNALGFYFAFVAFDIHVPFAGALFIQSVISLAVSLPSGPGFFGTFESAARLVLVDLFLVDINKAMGFALGFHLGGFIPVTLIGLYYAWRLGLSWREVEHAEESVEEAVERELPPQAQASD
jgi:uncharacterized protein (TIRG00374 family)